MKSKLSSFLLVLTLGVSILLFPHATQATNEKQVSIHNYSELEVILKVPYGDKIGEVGFTKHGTEGIQGEGVTSFYVYKSEFFILDNVNKRILHMDKNGNVLSTIELNYSWYLEDLLVLDKIIYVLDSGNRVVYKIDKTGKLLEKYKVPEKIEIPTGLGQTSDGTIFVDQVNDIQVNLFSNSVLSATDLQINTSRLNDKAGQILLNNKGASLNRINIPFEESYGSLVVHAANENQIIYSKTEVAADIPTIMAELHLYVADKAGNTLGAVRIPHENMYHHPHHLIRVENNNIYLLSVEEDNLSILELTPGKSFEKKLQKRIQEFKNQVKNNEIQIDYYSPELDGSDLQINANNGKNGYLHRSDAVSRANAMINHQWKVVSGNKGTRGTLPDYVRNASVGTTLTGIPYNWGGSDGVDFGTGSRNNFSYYQTAGYQTGQTTRMDWNASTTGVDCSGFVGLAWFRTDEKYGTSTLYKITYEINKSALQSMDALNSTHIGHVVLFVSQGTSSVSTKEATTDGAGAKAKNYTRTWTYLDNNRYKSIRYNRIVDNGGSLPLPS